MAQAEHYPALLQITPRLCKGTGLGDGPGASTAPLGETDHGAPRDPILFDRAVAGCLVAVDILNWRRVDRFLSAHGKINNPLRRRRLLDTGSEWSFDQWERKSGSSASESMAMVTPPKTNSNIRGWA
jgi:hypothetical protein